MNTKFTNDLHYNIAYG